MEWPAFEWIYTDCFPDLIQLSSLLPQKEDNLRTRITKVLLIFILCQVIHQILLITMIGLFLVNKFNILMLSLQFLLDVTKHFGVQYLEHIMLPVFLVAVGDCDSADLTFFPPSSYSRIKGTYSVFVDYDNII